MKANKTTIDIATVLYLYQLDRESQIMLSKWLTSVADLRRSAKRNKGVALAPPESEEQTDGQ